MLSKEPYRTILYPAALPFPLQDIGKHLSRENVETDVWLARRALRGLGESEDPGDGRVPGPFPPAKWAGPAPDSRSQHASLPAPGRIRAEIRRRGL